MYVTSYHGVCRMKFKLEIRDTIYYRYGSHLEPDVLWVKNLYTDLNLPQGRVKKIFLFPTEQLCGLVFSRIETF